MTDKYDPLFQLQGEKLGIDWRLFKAMALCESSFDEQAKSPCGALGLMQIMPTKAKWLTIPFPGGPADTSTGKVMMRARDFKNTFIAKGMIFQRISKGEIRPLFILKKKVDMPARPYMYAEDVDIEYLKDSIVTYVRGEW